MLANRLPEILFWNPWLEAYFKWVKSLRDFEPSFKHGYLQHPSEVPLYAKRKKSRQKDTTSQEQTALNTGLCFRTTDSFAADTTIEITLFLNGSALNAEARVAWVEKDGDSHWVGVNFTNSESSYTMRMAEQICQIEHYRQDVLATQGRRLSQEQAAAEWVERYAARFPATI